MISGSVDASPWTVSSSENSIRGSVNVCVVVRTTVTITSAPGTGSVSVSTLPERVNATGVVVHRRRDQVAVGEVQLVERHLAAGVEHEACGPGAGDRDA